jgi:hypothetical protein
MVLGLRTQVRRRRRPWAAVLNAVGVSFSLDDTCTGQSSANVSHCCLDIKRPDAAGGDVGLGFGDHFLEPGQAALTAF